MGNNLHHSGGIRPRSESTKGSQQVLTQHQSFDCLAYPDWVSYASQTHVRDIDVDMHRGWMWMATWGGVLCWIPEENLCIRYTSVHGLIGNATRSLAVDESGVIWAGGQSGGLCYLIPGDGAPWISVDIQNWIALRLTPRPEGGVYAALRRTSGECALGEITPPNYQLRSWQHGFATKEIQTLFIDEDKTLWVGNLWGLHHQKSDGSFNTVQDLDLPVRALAGIGPMLWVGTDCGVYCVHTKQEKAHREPDWPLCQVTCLTVDPATGSKWLVTEQGLGRIVDNAWQPLSHFPTSAIHLNQLLVGKHDPQAKDFLDEYQTWAAGASNPEQSMAGLYRIGVDEYESVFGLDSEDVLSNAVQCLWVDDANVWVGTARGLCHFDGRIWRNCISDEPGLRDVRAILPGKETQLLWVGSGQTGFHRLRSGTILLDKLSSLCIVAMSAGENGTLWAATPDQLLYRTPTAIAWERTNRDKDMSTIQVVCATNEGIWVGTKEGLWCYKPDSKLWHRPVNGDALMQLSIQTLVIDPSNCRLWAGTNAGLYSLCQGDWIRSREADIHAIAFTPEGTMWLGTDTGLEEWLTPADGAGLMGNPLAYFTAARSGLAADLVTALAVRTAGNQRQVWIGSTAGMSCYEYTI